MPLGQPAYGGVATHGRYVVKINGQEQCRVSHTGSGKRSLASGVTRSDHDYIIFFIISKHDGINTLVTFKSLYIFIILWCGDVPWGSLFRGEIVHCPIFCITLSKGGRRASSQINHKGGLVIYPELRRPPDDIPVQVPRK
jgi:hypothetical protein